MHISINPAGLVEKPPKHGFNWDAYNSSFESVDISSFELLENISRGHSFSSVFSGKRSQANFILSQHIGVDFDDGQHSLTELLSDPFILAYASIIYPSLSHTPDHPRYRVVFCLDQAINSAVGYEAALNVVKKLYPSSDQACYEVSRQFYGNGKVHRDNLWEACYYNDTTLPLADLRVIARQQMQQAKQRQPVRQPESRHQDHNDDLQDVMAKLSRVDAYALSYEEWVAVGAALARKYGDAALWGFKQWSDRPGKDPVTVAYWNSLKRDHPRPATLGTVFKMIQQYAA